MERSWDRRCGCHPQNRMGLERRNQLSIKISTSLLQNVPYIFYFVLSKLKIVNVRSVIIKKKVSRFLCNSALKLKNMWVPTLSFKPSKMSPITFTAHRLNFHQLHDPRNLGFVSLSRQTFKNLGFPPLPPASKPQKIAPSPNTQTLAMVSFSLTSQPP